MSLPFGRFCRVFNRGLKAAAGCRFDEAVECLTRAAELRPEEPRVRLQLGLALSESGRYEEGLAAAGRALSLDRADGPVVLLFSGMMHLDHGEPGLAREQAERSLELDGLNPLARGVFALADWDLGRRMDAMEDISGRIPVLAPRFEARLLARVEMAFQEFSNTRAFGCCLCLPESDPAAYPAFLIRPLFRWFRKRRVAGIEAKAAALARKGRHEQELALIEGAFGEFPPEKAVRDRVVRTRKKAMKNSLVRLKEDPENFDLLYGAGCLCRGMGDYKMAKKHIGRWLEGDLARRDDGGDALFRTQNAFGIMCESELAAGNISQAAAHVKRLRKTGDESCIAGYLEGRCLLLQDKRFEAIHAFEGVLRREPDLARYRLRALAKTDNRVQGSGPTNQAGYDKTRGE